MAKKVARTTGIFAANARTVATRVGDLACIKHDKFIGHSLDIYGEWAQNEIDRLLEYIRPGDFVIDVGANVGFHTLSFARQVGQTGTVWAFEPDPVNGLLLRLNIVNSGMHGSVIPFDLALSSELGFCRFRSYPISMPENFGHTAIDREAGNYPRVAIPLDLLQIEQAPSLIKIDIEGGEQLALEGMRGLIERYGPVLSVEADSEDDADAIASQVSAMGYDVHDFVTDAFNSQNFAGLEKDIWNGHGRCANLLCIKPGKHPVPEGMPLRRAAALEVEGLSQVGRSLSAAYSASADGALSGSDRNPVSAEMASFRADVRNFVGAFLRATYGKLDPKYYGAVVNSALDYLSADGPEIESEALRSFVVSGIDAFAGAVTRASDDAKQLLTLESELVLTRGSASQLEDALARIADAEQTGSQLAAELQQLQSEHRAALDALALARTDGQTAHDVADSLNRALAQQSKAASAELERLNGDVEALRQAQFYAEASSAEQINALNQAIDVSEQFARDARQERDASRRELETVQAQLHENEAALAEQQRLRERAEASLRESETALAEQQRLRERADARLLETEAALAEQQRLREGIEASLRDAETALAEQEKLRNNSEAELHQQAANLASAVAEQKRLQELVEAGSAECDLVVARMRTEMVALKAEVEAERQGMEREFSQLRAEHAETLDRLAAQAQEIRRLRAIS